LTGDSSDVVIWSFLEDYTAVICSSLMAIRPLLTKYMPWTLGSTLASQKNGTYSTSHPQRNVLKSTGTFRDHIDGSTIELGSAEGLKGADEWGGCEEDIYDTKSRGLGSADGACISKPGYTSGL
jgi:hypothetical protein